MIGGLKKCRVTCWRGNWGSSSAVTFVDEDGTAMAVGVVVVAAAAAAVVNG